MAKKRLKDSEGEPAVCYRSPDIPLSAIRRYARRIGERFRPEKVILFGSYAYGQPHEDSDVDLLVVMPAYDEINQAVRIRLAIESPFPLDLIVKTPERLRRGIEDENWFLREIVSKGKVLFGRNPHRAALAPPPQSPPARRWPTKVFNQAARPSMKRETKSRVHKAENDLRGARSLDDNTPNLHDLICYHCQQSAERYLKALIQESGQPVPRTHDLHELLKLLRPLDAKLGALQRVLGSLNQYAVTIRYPKATADRRKAQAALRHAEKVRAAVRERLGLGE